MAVTLAWVPVALAQGDSSTGRVATDFVRVLVADGFDEVGGTLVAADIAVRADLDSRVLKLTNSSSSPADFLVTTKVRLCADLAPLDLVDFVACDSQQSPTKVSFQADALTEPFVDLGAGESEASPQPQTMSDIASVRVTDPEVLRFFRESGQVSFRVASLAGFEAFGGGGNTLVEVETYADVRLAVTYLVADVQIDKRTNGGDDVAVDLGGAIEWTYDVTNTGNTALQNVRVIDDREGEVCVLDLLDAGVTERCSATGEAGLANYVNVGSVMAESAVNPVVTVTDEDASSYVVRAATPTPVPASTPLPTTATTEIDPDPDGDPSSDPDPDGDPDRSPDDPSSDPDREDDPDGDPDDPNADPSDLAPAIDIELATNGFDADLAPGVRVDPGDPITWTYVVTNVGAVELVEVVVRDDRSGGVCRADSIAVNERQVCTVEGTAVGQAGVHKRTAHVVGESVVGQQVTDSDPTHHDLDDGVVTISMNPPPGSPDGPPALGGDPPSIPDGDLATTGTNVLSYGRVAVVMLGLGAGVVVAGRARRKYSPAASVQDDQA